MKTSSRSEKELKGEKMHQLFEDNLKDLYWAEKELTTFMPELVSQLTSKELADVLEEHMKLTEKQVVRLEKIFKTIGSKAEAHECPAMKGLVEEAEKIIRTTEQSIIRDAFIIGAVQKVEHYEMASYGTLRALAILMGEFEVASLLKQTLDEEKEADENLTDIAENLINIEASREAGELEDEEGDDLEDLLDEVEDEEEAVRGRSGKGSSRSRQF